MKRLLARAALVGVVCLLGLSGTASGMSRSRIRTRPVREGHPHGDYAGRLASVPTERITGRWLIQWSFSHPWLITIIDTQSPLTQATRLSGSGSVKMVGGSR